LRIRISFNMSKLYFQNIVFINGVGVRSYSLSKGERVEAYFPDKGSTAIYHVNDKPFGKNLIFLFDGKGYHVDFQVNKPNYFVYQTQVSLVFSTVLVTVFYDNGYTLVLDKGDNCNVYPLNDPTNIESGVIGDYLFVKYKEEDLFKLLVFSFDTLELVFKTKGQKIEIGQNIEREFFVDDLCKHHVTQTFDVNGQGISENSFFVECSRAHTFTYRLYPLLLLQAIKCKDANVRTYLHDDLKESVSAFFDFFGDIEQITPLSDTLIKVHGKDRVKLYSFTLKDGLIADIDELE